MEMLSTLLALYEGTQHYTSGSPYKGPVMVNIDVFFDVILKKSLEQMIAGDLRCYMTSLHSCYIKWKPAQVTERLIQINDFVILTNTGRHMHHSPIWIHTWKEKNKDKITKQAKL